MVDDKKPEKDESQPMSKLLSGDAAGFVAAMDELQRGPAGAHIRLLHLREFIAERLFAGDFVKAERLLDLPNADLGGLSVKEAAETHENMLKAKELVEKLEACGFSEGAMNFAEGVHFQWRQEYDLLIDMLPAAWGMIDEEFEQLLQTPTGWLQANRNHEVSPGPKILLRLRRLRSLHNAFRTVVRPQGYAEAWRRVWVHSSPIGKRSPWQAYQEDGDRALDLVEAYFCAQR
jgi:hypothetical protein